MAEQQQTDYDVDSLEAAIDRARGRGRWDEVVTRTEQYVSVFDVGSATRSRQNDGTRAAKAYYWSVLAEAFFASQKKVETSLECALKSLELDAEYLDAKVIVCRILLELCGPLLQRIRRVDQQTNSTVLPFTIAPFVVQTSEGQEDEQHQSEAAAGGGCIPPTFVEKEVLADAFLMTARQSAQLAIPASDQAFLLQILSDASAPLRNSLLAILDSLSVQDQVITCLQVLAVVRCDPSKRPSNECLFAVWVLVTSRLLLADVRLDQVHALLEAKRISEYRLWIRLDAVATRGSICEALGDNLRARSDYTLIARHASTPLLPPTCRSTVTSALSRLPSIEAALDMPQEALASLDRCVLAEPALSPPIPVLLGLKVVASLMLLERSRVKSGSAMFANSNAAADLRAQAEISKAQRMLQSVMRDMSTDVGSENAPRMSLNRVLPQPRSMVLLLPAVPSDPTSLISFVNSRVVGSLLASILRRACGGGSSQGQGAEVLEWGCSMEVRPSADLLYHLAMVLAETGGSGAWERVSSALMQSHGLVARELQSRRASSSSFSAAATGEVRRGMLPLKHETQMTDVLRWLGRGPTPSEQPWLPALALGREALRLRGDPWEALSALRSCISDLFGAEAASVLCDTGSDAASASASVAGNVYFDPDAPDYNLVQRYSNSALESEGLLRACGPPSEGGSDAFLTAAGVGSFEAAPAGFGEIMLALGTAHAAASRLPRASAMEQRGQLIVALRCLSFVLERCGSGSEEAAGAGLLGEARLQRAVVLAELGEIYAALTEVRAALSSSQPRSAACPRLLHLHALLLAASADDDAETVGAAVVACRNAADAEAPLTLAMASLHATSAAIKWGAGDAESALLSARQVLSFFLVTERQRGQADDDARRAQLEAEVVACSGGSELALADAMDDSSAEAPSSSSSSSSSFSQYRLVASRGSSLHRRKSVEMLLTASRVFRSAGDFSKAMSCAREAWRILFTASDLTTVGMVASTHGLTDHRRQDLLRSVPSLLGWKLPECCGWAASADSLPDCEADVLVEAGRIVAAKAELRGKVEKDGGSDGAEQLYRFALAVFPQSPAALIAVAEAELAKEASGRKPKGQALNGVHLAALLVAEDPRTRDANAVPVLPPSSSAENPFQAILAARDLGVAAHAKRTADAAEPGRGCSLELAHLGEQGHATRACEFARLAINAAELSAQAWCVYGRALEKLHQPQRAAEALMSSIEVAKFEASPRAFSVALL